MADRTGSLTELGRDETEAVTLVNSLKREARFVLRDRAFVTWILVVLGAASFAVWSGIAEVEQQRESIAFLSESDRTDRTEQFTSQSDWGAAAYYSFHLTHDAPSNFAFAALGQRDTSSWKHRIRMLALEGQIYEHDPGNPELALVGRFDFAFFVAFVLPLILIFILHDMQASERSAGRFNLLVASVADDRSLWRYRALVRSAGVLIAAIIPLTFGGIVSGTSACTLATAAAWGIAYGIFWTIVCSWVASRDRNAQTILASLVGIWILLSTIIPAGSRVLIEHLVPIPEGADILMTQREAVNDAWDLPVSATMTPFYARHPEWTGYEYTGDGFEWGWYYAFQQVGDQTAESLSDDYREGRVERDRLASLFALAAPPALLERQLQNLAATDMQSVLAYENRVRLFHSELRNFYYPGLFGNQPFDPARVEDLPEFIP